MGKGMGDADRSFEGFVAERAARLWHAAWLLTGDSHHAEDLVQSALARTYHRYPDIGSDAQFEAYVRTTMYRTFVSWWRRLSWRSERASETVDDASAATTPDGRLDLVRALDELPRMQRVVLVLQYFEDLSTAQIAERLGISAGSVKTHAHRGRQALRGSRHLREE